MLDVEVTTSYPIPEGVVHINDCMVDEEDEGSFTFKSSVPVTYWMWCQEEEKKTIQSDSYTDSR